METRDFECAISCISQKYPMAPVCCIACSAGAHVLVPYLAKCGREPRKSPFVCATTISGCLDFDETYNFVEGNQIQAYKNMLNKAMRRCVERHHEHDIHSSISAAKLQQLLSIKRANVMYDRHISTLQSFVGATEPGSYGANPKFCSSSDPESYSTEASWEKAVTKPFECEFPLKETKGNFSTPARDMIGDITTTMLMIHAKDDTLVPYVNCVDWEKVKNNQHIITAVTKRGGHVGFHEWKGFLTGLSWAENMALDFVSSVLEAQASTGFLIDVISKGLDAENFTSCVSRRTLNPAEVSSICSSSNIPRAGRLEVRGDARRSLSFHDSLSREPLHVLSPSFRIEKDNDADKTTSQRNASLVNRRRSGSPETGPITF